MIDVETSKTINGFFASLPKWGIEEESGYKPCTTFWQDFSIADRFGIKAITDTYRQSRHWKYNCTMWTELVMVLNHKLWYWYELAEEARKEGETKKAEYYTALSHIYDTLWREADSFIDSKACKWTAEEREYYCRTLD